MNDLSQISAQISQIRDLVVNEALATAQQVQAGAQQIQNPPAPAQTDTGSSGLVWFGLGTITALVVGYYLWRKGK